MQHDTHQQRGGLLPPFAAQVQAREDKTKRKLPPLQFCFFSNVTTYWTLTVEQFNHEAPDYTSLHLLVWYWCTSSMKNTHLLRSAYSVTPVEEVQITLNLITSCLSFAMSLLASTAALAHAHGSCFFPLHWHAPRVASWKENKQKKENLHLEEAVLLVLLGHMAFTGKVKSIRKYLQIEVKLVYSWIHCAEYNNNTHWLY